jgi:hypothetical protein
MRWQHRVSISQLIAIAAIHEIKKEETGPLEDISIATTSALSIVLIWKPTWKVIALGVTAPYVAPSALAIAAPLAIGTGVSYAIGGEQGVVDYYEFITEPTKWVKRTEESIAVITEEVIKPSIESASAGFNWILTGASNWVDRKLQEAKQGLPSWLN